MKINTTLIEGYDEMSAEEKLAAVLAYEYEDNAAELRQLQADNQKLKSVNDALSTENAKYKNDSRSKLSEKDQEIENLKEQLESQTKAIDELNKVQRLTARKASLLQRGYTEEQASEGAEALENGDIDSFLKLSDTYVSAQKEAYKDELMKGTAAPQPSAGRPSGNVDYLKLASEAQYTGDPVKASYYMRLAQQQQTPK